MERSHFVILAVCGTLLVAATPAERRIETAHAALERGGAPAAPARELAIGFVRRARETGDACYYQRALEVLEQAQRLASEEDPEARKITAWILLGRHEFARAAELASAHTREHPQDHEAFGLLGDALMELGRQEEAEAAYQRMMDLRPGPGAYLRAAYAREVRGDLEGALELLESALQATPPSEAEERAWILVQIGGVHELRQDWRAAERARRAALAEFPDYHYALAALAPLALRDGRAAEAETLARRALASAPHAERELALADALRAQGQEAAAREAEDRFEAGALANTENPDNENHDLVAFYLVRKPDPPRALAIARREAERRQDFRTLDRLAWALHQNGQAAEAAATLRRALATGTRDPELARHAEEILGSADLRVTTRR